MWVAYLIGFGLTFVLSLGATWLATRAAGRLGLLDHPSERKLHTTPVPLGGGLAIVSSILAVLALAAVVIMAANARPDLIGLPEGIEVHIPGLVDSLKKYGVVALGAIILMVMGLVDDKRGVSAGKKLIIQIIVAILLVASGLSATLFLPWRPAGWLVTIAWIVFVTNAFNLLDNMDGLSSGVALIIAAVFFAVALLTGQLFIAAFLAIFAGGVLGFLVFNFPPAKIFMGDAGSYAIGYFLGVAALAFKFVPPETTKASALPLALPFLLFAVPFYDTLSVIVIRIREGRHPFDADKRHFSHRLCDLGLSRREAVFTIYAATLVTAFPAIYLYELGTFALMGAVVQALLVLLLVAILEHAGARKIGR